MSWRIALRIVTEALFFVLVIAAAFVLGAYWQWSMGQLTTSEAQPLTLQRVGG